MNSVRTIKIAGSLTAIVLLATGCTQNADNHAHHKNTGSAVPDAAARDKKNDADATIQAIRDKLSAEDRALVEAQEWCVVQTDERLGSMGPPVKLIIKDKPVFLCCKGCRKQAEADPEKTLAKVEELKAKKAAPLPK